MTNRVPEHVVCEWIGNIRKVAREHYLRVTEADFEQASGGLIETHEIQGASKSAASRVSTRAEKLTDSDTLLLEIVKKALENSNLEQVAATIGKAWKSHLVPRVGLEPTTY